MIRSSKFAGLLLAAVLVFGSGWAAADSRDLAAVKQAGQIRVALYKDFAPFSDDGKGVSVELAKLLADKLGVKLDILWFDADENVDDDLRNMVWKGTVFGYGPADVMLHVPVDKEYMAKNEKVLFFAPYYRERFGVVRNVAAVPKLESLEPFRSQKIGVEGATYPDHALLSAESGALISNIIHYKTTMDAIAALKKGEVSAVAGMRGELEAGSAGAGELEIGDLPIPVLNRKQWPLGMAVKAGHEELARALQKALNELVADGSVEKVFRKFGVQYRAP